VTLRRWSVVAVALTAVAGAAVVGVAGMAALSAADALERARDGLVRAQEPTTTTAASLAALHRAQDDVEEAGRALSGWPVDVVAAVPVVGRSWDVERAVTRTAQEVIGGARVLGDRLPTLKAGAGGVDLAALADVRAELEVPVQRSEQALAELRSTSAALTPLQVGEARASALEALAPAVETLGQAHRGLDVVSGLLGEAGPRSLLVMLQNNAELRGAGGYAATFATGRLQDGQVALDPLRDVIAVADPPARARAVAAPPEYVEDFGHLAGNTTQWRSWNMSPHVPDSALVGARVAGRLLDREPDVVVLLDVPAMAALAALGGDRIELPDGSAVTPDELSQALLVDAYAQAGAGGQAQKARRLQLQAAATTAVTQLLAGDIPASEAARTLARLAQGRHLAVWSARASEQSALVELGAAGAVTAPRGGDLAHVSVNNVGSNKLDLYVERELDIDVTVHADRVDVVQRVRFTNEAPGGLVPYVAGTERPGVVVSRVELSVPPAASAVAATIDGRPWAGTVHSGPERQRLATRLELPRGASSELEVRYVLPVEGGSYRLRVVPQALVEDATLTLAVRPAAGERLGRVDGASRSGGVVQERGALTEERDITVSLYEEPPGRWQRFRTWWNSPVELG